MIKMAQGEDGRATTLMAIEKYLGKSVAVSDPDHTYPNPVFRLGSDWMVMEHPGQGFCVQNASLDRTAEQAATIERRICQFEYLDFDIDTLWTVPE